MSARLLPAAFLLLLSPVALAQDKPAAADRPAPPPAVNNTGRTEAQWEAELHTSDCSKMPNRTLQIDCREAHYEIRTLQLKNASTLNEENEILVAIRNMADPSVKVFLLSAQDIVVLGSYPQELDRLIALIHTLDQPHRTYRLTFTLATMEGDKRIGVQHFSQAVMDGQRVTLKQGNKVPLATGSKDGDTQFQYIDLGVNLDATPSRVGDKLLLKCKAEQSAVADSVTIKDVREPLIRQSVYEGVTLITPGKPTTLGSFDASDSNRRVDIEVLAELLP